MPETEDALLNQAIAGDRESLGELVLRHAPAVRRSLAGKIDARWQAVVTEDDILQETFADALLAITNFESRGPGSFVGWLTTLARNNLLRALEGLQTLKRGGDRTRVQSQDSHVDLLERLGGTTTSPSIKAARQEAKTALDGALAKLPDSYRMVVSLYDLAACSVDDVCEACGCSPGAMFMRRSRAHSMLQSLLVSHAEN
jgi:RNA polymerase sigma-70 factor (ECF subfamily)